MEAFRFWDTHVQLAAGDAFDACVHRPRAGFELQLTVFDSELTRTFLFLLELPEEPARLMLRRHQAKRTGGEHEEKEKVQADHRGSRRAFRRRAARRFWRAGWP